MIIIYTLLDIVEYPEVERYTSLLPAERRERIARFRFDSDKLRGLAAGLLIRYAVGDVQLGYNEHGKPYAVSSDVFFSVSHSDMFAAIAVDSAEVGLDVEKLTDKDYIKLARRFYHSAELQYVEESDDPVRAFTRVWTRKEAYLKQLGIGISTDLKGFDTTSPELSSRIVSLDLDGYCLSVCTQFPITPQDINISCIELKDLLDQT